MNVMAPRFALPSELTGRTATLAFFDGTNQPVRPAESALQQASQQAVQQADNAAAMAAPGAPQNADMTPISGSGKYTGGTSMVKLKGLGLRDYFRLVHGGRGMELVLDPASR